MPIRIPAFLFLLFTGFLVEAQSLQPEAFAPQRKRNILSFSPIQMTNESAVGLGLQYEYFPGKKDVFSIYLPVAIAFYTDEVAVETDRVFTYLYPGVKIYPGGSERRLTYSVGPSAALGFGNRYIWTDDLNAPGSSIGYYSEGNMFKLGFVVNNGINVRPTDRLYVGAELGLGVMYYTNAGAENNEGNEPITQFQFKMGYRF